MLNELLLLSGNNIPFQPAQIIIHQPTIKEIALIGEDMFYTGCEMLTFSKDNLSEEDRNNLVHQTDFEILMSILMSRNLPSEAKKNKIALMMVLSLLFPDYEIKLGLKEILLSKEDEVHSINSQNFEKFKEILIQIFCLRGISSSNSSEYNPGGQLAKQIADKFKKRRQILAAQQGEQKISILSRYVSILSVGERKDMNDLLQYTIYQLFDEFNRYELKEEFDYILKARLAGARDLKDPDNWKKDIHE